MSDATGSIGTQPKRRGMGVTEALADSLANLSAHKLRSALTTLGIVFGVGAVIAMLSIGAGAEREAMESIGRLGLKNVVVRAKELRDEDLREVREKSLGVSLRDAEAIRDAVRGVDMVAPVVEIEAYKVFSGGRSVEAEIYGVAESHDELTDLHLAEGRFLDRLDLREHAQVAVLGDGVRRALFGYEPAVGQQLKINDVWLEVVGALEPVLAESSSFEGVAIGSTSTAIFVPVSTALRKFDRDPLASPLSEIMVRLEEEGTGRRVAEAISGLLSHLHGNQDDYELVVPEALLAEKQRTQRMFNIVMGCIAGISLLVGGIGIMNIMLASVLERTREIGVRRAVGARQRDIVTQFMVESFALSAFGGMVGILMGVAIARVVALSAGWTTLVTWWSIALASGVALAVGLSSGLYPALRASKLDPIESLRYE